MNAYVTDATHLHQLVDKLQGDIVALAIMWIEEDAGAHAPRSRNDVGSGGGISDPTGGIADDRYKTRDRDAIGALIVRTLDQVQREVRRHRTTTPQT